MKRLFTAAMLLVVTTISANAQLVINEIMQSNVECIMDDIKEFPDSWVELYNSGDSAVHLQYYMIGTKPDVSKAWQLPNITLGHNSYVIIYCDKEGKTDNRLHADFRLESGKDGNLYLFQKEKADAIDKLEKMAKMPAPDIAYGRATDGANEWGYQLTPTPGKANTGDICNAKHILGAPVFSEHGQICESGSSFQLKLSLPEKTPGGEDTPEGTIICYTTDGSEPTGKFEETTVDLETTYVFKPTGSSKLYNAPINITSTKVIRAKLFCNGYLSPVSTAQSYIFHPRTMTVPIFSVLTKDAYLNDAEIGLIANNNSKEDKKLHDWRRPVNIEMFTSEGTKSIFNQLGETRIQGGQSRANALKSMVFYANKRFDPDHKQFQYEFFPDQKPGIKKFKSFSLRDGGNDFSDLYFRDLIIQRTMGENTDIDWQAGHTAVLYINGEYMGMLNIRERSNEDNIESNYGIEDMDMVEISHEKVNNVDQFIEEFKGSEDDTFYKNFKTFYSQTGHTLAEYEQWLDVSEYLNIMIMNLFYCNIDFPGNNLVFWRPNNDDKSGRPKRWRVIAKDTDFGLGLYGWSETSRSSNTIDMIYNPSRYTQSWAFSDQATRLFRNMMENQDIKNMFIDKSCVYMGDFMNASGTGEMIDKIKAEAMEEFVAHRDKYNGHYNNQGVWIPATNDNRSDIENKFNDAKKWVAGYKQGNTTYQPRSYYFLQHISKKYLNNISSIPVTINQDVDDAELPDNVLVNNIKLTKGVFDGKLFKENRQITLEGNTNDDSNLYVIGWEIEKNGVSEESVEGSTYTFKIDNSYQSLHINAIMRPQVCIGQREAVSYSSTMPLDFSRQTDVKAYIVIESGNKFIKKQVFKVPAETGLVIEGPQGIYKIPVAAANACEDVQGNLLVSTAKKAFTVPDDGNAYYGLFYSYDQERVGFKKKDKGYTFPKGKSYLFLSQDHQAKEFTELFFDGIIDGIATDIQGANHNKWTEGQIYNLNGQRVDKNYNGVIIVNGKKVINNRK